MDFAKAVYDLGGQQSGAICRDLINWDDDNGILLVRGRPVCPLDARRLRCYQFDESQIALLEQDRAREARRKHPKSSLVTRTPAVTLNSALPAELLSEIFTLALENLVAEIAYPPITLALTVAQVCQFWRRVALGLPHLWACLTCPKPALLDPFLDHYLPLVQGHTLRLRSHKDPALFRRTVARLGPRISRSRRIILVGSASVLSSTTLGFLPQLESAFVHVEGKAARDTEYEPLAFLRNVPLLSQLHLSVQALRGGIDLGLPSTTCITYLSIDIIRLASSSLLMLLRQCSKTLQTLRIRMDFLRDDAPDERVWLHALQELHIVSDHHRFLSCIVTPRLRSLVIPCFPNFESGDRDLCEYFTHVPSAAAHLRSLRVGGVTDILSYGFRALSAKVVYGTPRTALSQCIAFTPNLEELHLGPVRHGDHQSGVCRLLDTLRYSSEGGLPLLPKLRIVSMAGGLSEEKSALAAFARARGVCKEVNGATVAAVRIVPYTPSVSDMPCEFRLIARMTIHF
ncbi:hypothetical protein HDZ31DRAFT_37048 [Schizophyllum fasciatum]